MAIVEDMLKGNLVAAAAMGATALVLPRVLPALPAPLRSAVKGGVSLFLESESEAEGGIVDRLADNALKNTLKELSGPGSADDRRGAAQAVVEKFKQTARSRAQRYGHDENDRSARYSRHTQALQRAIGRERSRKTGANDAVLAELAASLGEAAPRRAEENQHGPA